MHSHAVSSWSGLLDFRWCRPGSSIFILISKQRLSRQVEDLAQHGAVSGAGPVLAQLPGAHKALGHARVLQAHIDLPDHIGQDPVTTLSFASEAAAR